MRGLRTLRGFGVLDIAALDGLWGASIDHLAQQVAYVVFFHPRYLCYTPWSYAFRAVAGEHVIYLLAFVAHAVGDGLALLQRPRGESLIPLER